MTGIIGGAGSRSGIIGQTELEYEEGEFGGNGANETLYPATSGSITCDTSGVMAYTKVGDICHVTGQISVSGISSPSGASRLKLPFVVKNGTDVSCRFGAPFACEGVTFPTSRTLPFLGTFEGESYAELYFAGPGVAKETYTMESSTGFFISFSYFTA